MSNSKIKAIVIGVSQGGLDALNHLLPMLPRTFNKAVIIVQHRSADSDGYLIEHLNLVSEIKVKEAEEKELIAAGIVYVAAPGYHLLVETDGTLSLNDDEPVNLTRPAIDVLFDSAADYFGQAVLGIILTGNNSDGAKGLLAIKNTGGLAVVQDPDEALVSSMPKAAIKITQVDQVLPLLKIGEFLVNLP